jgi:RPA family protein
MRERLVAVRASVADIVNGTYSEDDGPKIVSPFGVELRRVVLVGVVVDQYSGQGNFATVTIDDGTETIRAKAWGAESSALEKVAPNTLVTIIGKVRQYDNEVYIVPEIVRELTDSNYITLHKLERLRAMITRSGVSTGEASSAEEDVIGTAISVEARPAVTTSGAPTSVEDTSSELKSKQILQFIQKHAKPDGVSIEDIVSFFEKKGHSKSQIQLKVIDLQGEDRIREVKVGRYVLTDA